ICVSLSMVNGWLLLLPPPSDTEVALVRPVPVSTTVPPGATTDGFTLVSVGRLLSTMKLVADIALPEVLVIVILPLVAPAGTAVMACESLIAATNSAGVPLKLAPDSPVKLLPLRITTSPVPPLAGVKLVSVGSPLDRTMNVIGLEPVPPALRTLNTLLEAPSGTVAVICVSESMVAGQSAKPSCTLPAPVKPLPGSVTTVPAGPAVGFRPAT